MSATDPSKETPLSFNPGFPPVYGAGPMPGVNPAFESPPYNSGYPHGNVVTTQPTVIVAPARAYETDYLGYSIFTMLCCCLPVGIAALVYSIKTRDANNRGDAPGAHANSRTALKLNKFALGFGIGFAIIAVANIIYFFTRSTTNYYG